MPLSSRNMNYIRGHQPLGQEQQLQALPRADMLPTRREAAVKTMSKSTVDWALRGIGEGTPLAFGGKSPSVDADTGEPFFGGIDT